MMKTSLWIILITIVLCSLAAPLQAKTKGFVAPQLKGLEQQMIKKYGLEGIADKLTHLHDPLAQQAETDDALKLFVVTRWLDQGTASEAINLMNTTHPVVEYNDLYDYYQVITAIHDGRVAQCLEVLNGLETRHPGDHDLLYLKSIYLSETGQVQEAIDLLSQIIRGDSKNGSAFLQRGVLNLVAMNPNVALKDFQSALSRFSKTEVRKRQQAYLQIGIIYIRYELDGKKGEEYLEKGIALDPQSDLVAQVKQALR